MGAAPGVAGVRCTCVPTASPAPPLSLLTDIPRTPTLWHPKVPEKSLSLLAFATGLRFALNPEKMLKKQCCGMRGQVESCKTAALVITGGKVRAWIGLSLKPTIEEGQ